MKPAKKLVLKRELLAELSSDELGQVAGGSHYCMTLPVNLCLSLRVCYVTHELACLVPTLPDTCLC
jgi:hypothetical protein